MKVYRFQKKFPEGFLVDWEQMLGKNGMKLTKKGKNGMKLTKKGWRNMWGGFLCREEFKHEIDQI